ncbi:FadR/GntR family transcriptional regulator [Nonomuraea dietziae]|uniref:FadR/GntR family transcriptional regulator n=1 Tax=Nonomuraea dietziae TaxID=65515 RepID=UPI0031E1FE81
MRLSRAVEVQQAVKEIILSRRLAAGDPLPTETELMEELGASRNSVREALKALQAVGIVDIRHGFGMFVGRMSLNGLVDELAFHSRIRMHDDGPRQLGHLVEIREVLEAGLVERLIDLGGEADLSPVAEVMARMSAEAEVGIISPETDRLFHDVLYRPLGNPLVGQLLGAFWDVYHQLRDHLGRAGRVARRPGQASPRHLHRGRGGRQGGGGGGRPRPLRGCPQPPGQAHLAKPARITPARMQPARRRALSLAAMRRWAAISLALSSAPRHLGGEPGDQGVAPVEDGGGLEGLHPSIVLRSQVA